MQYVVNLSEQKQSFLGVVSCHLMAGALTGSSSNWSVQKISEAVNQKWMVIVDAVLGWFSLSNRALGIRKDNCKR